ncbi:BamA/TamA family outer membrane protein [Halocola ammonii]
MLPLFFVIDVGVSQAQEDSTSNSLLGLPVVFYTPETRWGFGAAGIYNFRFDHQDTISPPSQLQAGFAYTQEDQLLTYLPFQLYWNERKYSLTGEVGYYRYSYFYYGIGNSVPTDFEELYFVNYPRLRAVFLRKLTPNLFAGFRYWFENFDMRNTDPEGRLEQRNVTGVDGGVTSGLGMVVSYDSRDNVYFSSKGALAEIAVQPFESWLGSEFQFVKMSADLRCFIPIGDRFVWANQFYAERVDGEVPFNMLALLGGTKRMRGFYEGRFRDNNNAIFQTELRADVYWRFGAVGFFSVGNVAHEFGAFKIENSRYTYGGGIRFLLDPEKKINVRLDAGFGSNSESAFYLTFGEAF